MRRWAPLVSLFAVVATACGGESGTTGEEAGETVRVAQPAPSRREDVPSALDDPDDDRLPAPLVDTDEIIPGGPPPDGIPPVDEPRFQAVGAVDWLEDEEPVLALEVGGEWRAYPVQILTWHEIVNDTIARTPVAVTYCPLCNTAIAFDRRVRGRILDFGTSGKLYRSALVMYDRQTESLWTHFTGGAVAGFLTGTELRAFPMSTVSWADFKATAPDDALVLGRDTGHSRDYGRNPYPGYDDVSTPPFLFEGEVDGRLAAKERVVGIEWGGEAVAVLTSALADQRVVEVELGGETVTVWWKPGTASALEARSVAAGRDVGATGAFRSVLDGRKLSFAAHGDRFVDDATGSSWDVFGRATSGPLEGKRLEPVPHVDTFWFAWAAYLPHTSLEP
ncbi:MAG TPA: DUF3179 domain-containing protein [Acidimicrobiales bacterium]|nr:DUF3179 domain-containing protein [Acidimicrobiales bacterium]